MRIGDEEIKMEPDFVCSGNGEQIPWEQFKKMKEQEAEINKNTEIQDKDC